MNLLDKSLNNTYTYQDEPFGPFSNYDKSQEKTSEEPSFFSIIRNKTNTFGKKIISLVTNLNNYLNKNNVSDREYKFVSYATSTIAKTFSCLNIYFISNTIYNFLRYKSNIKSINKKFRFESLYHPIELLKFGNKGQREWVRQALIVTTVFEQIAIVLAGANLISPQTSAIILRMSSTTLLCRQLLMIIHAAILGRKALKYPWDKKTPIRKWTTAKGFIKALNMIDKETNALGGFHKIGEIISRTMAILKQRQSKFFNLEKPIKSNRTEVVKLNHKKPFKTEIKTLKDENGLVNGALMSLAFLFLSQSLFNKYS